MTVGHDAPVGLHAGSVATEVEPNRRGPDEQRDVSAQTSSPKVCGFRLSLTAEPQS